MITTKITDKIIVRTFKYDGVYVTYVRGIRPLQDDRGATDLKQAGQNHLTLASLMRERYFPNINWDRRI